MRDLTAYEQAYIDGLTAYSWWSNRIQWIGREGQTLDAAIALFLNRKEAK